MSTLIIISSLCTYAGKEKLLGQLTTAQYDSSRALETTYTSGGRRVLSLSSAYCDILQEKREDIRVHIGTPRYMQELAKLKPYQNLCYTSITVSDKHDDVVAFELTQRYEGDANRQYIFRFKSRSKHDLAIRITDDSGLTGRMSHDLLETTIQFLPRRIIPYIKVDTNSIETVRDVVLPTGESIKVDFSTSQIVGGVLSEMPIDLTASRHTRKFAGIKYSGKGIMIRADRRAGTPRHIYNTAFNSNEKTKHAKVFHQGKTCLIKKELLWTNAKNADLSAYLKYEGDEELLEKVINPNCGWNLSLSDIEP